MEDLIVIGAGPAGMAADLAARRHGVDPLVLDEAPQPGGQIYRAPPAEFTVCDARALGSTWQAGTELRAAVAKAGIRVRSGTMVWSLTAERVVEVVSGREPQTLSARRIIVAAGAYDRPVALPGWTLPGVFTIGGAQNFLKSQRLLVGRRILVAGTGPLLLVVASQLAKAGAAVVVADPVPRHHALAHLRGLLAEWRLLLSGAAYHRDLMRAGARWLPSAVVTSINGADAVESATVTRVDAEWRVIAGTEQTLEVDAVALGYGLLPSTELVRAAGCDMRYDERAHAWAPVLDDDLMTSIEGIAVAGDGGGVAGAPAALEQGRLTGIAAARAVGALDAGEALRLQQPHRDRLRRLNRFRDAVDRIYSLRPGIHELATAETVLCRCEEVTRAEIDDVVASGVTRAESLKHQTRAGMGACQGRMCMPALLQRLEAGTGAHSESFCAPRVREPVRPLPLASFEAR
jgi:NADPH-dependent 2,4-dienoyl-CoA reductase/sulfur reductase-like enzyme